jgi:Leucine-rich repeat (LRR) protein
MASNKKKRLFQNLGIWPTTTILSFFTPNELIEISRVNKEAHFITKKIFGHSKVCLEKINIRSVKLFKRAEKIKISQDSLGFFT